MAVTSEHVSVTGTAAVVYTPRVDSSGHVTPSLIRNSDATDSVFLGGPAVTTANGFELAAGDSIAANLMPGDIVYAITAGGTIRVDVLKAGQ